MNLFRTLTLRWSIHNQKGWATASPQPAFVASRSSRLRRLAPTGFNQAQGSLIHWLRTFRARRRLQHIVEANRNSFRTQLYAKNRAAQLKRRVAR